MFERNRHRSVHIAFACACSPVGSCLQPFGWATQLRIARGRVLPKPYQTYHMLWFCRGREGELQPSLLVTRPTSWQKRASPAAGCCPPVMILQAYRSCIKHAWVMCRGARLEASGLSRGAAQSPWFSHVGARKRNHARLGSTICSDAADPSPDALAAPRRKRILQCTQAAHGLSPTLA